MSYDLHEFLTARAALRQRLMLPNERFDEQRIVGMLSNEIEQALNRGITKEDLSDLLGKAGITLSSDDLAEHYERAKAYKAQKRSGKA